MTIKIEYFSDVLCVWAYSGQIRMDKLKDEFSDQIEIEYRFVPIFGAGKQHIEKVWEENGGARGFNQHLQDVAKKWDHITLSPELWVTVSPASSIAAHLYLKAIQLLVKQDEIDDLPVANFNNRTPFEEALWLFRESFFFKAKDIAQRCVQDEIAAELALPIEKIHGLMDSGKAYAALYLDDESWQAYKVPGSPTLVLNEGRQLLYGNVGYRIIQANVRELLHNPDHGEASWC